MFRSPLAFRFAGYALLGTGFQVAFAWLEPGSRTAAAPELWMFWLFGAGGLVLDGTDQLLRLPLPVRALVLVVCVYVLGWAVGWGLQAAGGDFPWDASAQGFAATGRVPLAQAPYWLALSICFRQIRDTLARVQSFLLEDGTAPAQRNASAKPEAVPAAR